MAHRNGSAEPQASRWVQARSGYQIVTGDGRILGRIERRVKFRRVFHQAYDENGKLMSGRLPLTLGFAQDMVEVRHKLGEDEVRR